MVADTRNFYELLNEVKKRKDGEYLIGLAGLVSLGELKKEKFGNPLIINRPTRDEKENYQKLELARFYKEIKELYSENYDHSHYFDRLEQLGGKNYLGQIKGLNHISFFCIDNLIKSVFKSPDVGYHKIGELLSAEDILHKFKKMSKVRSTKGRIRKKIPARQAGTIIDYLKQYLNKF